MLATLVSTALNVAPEGGFANPDWSAIGLVLAIVGSFLLANSILFRHPRQLVSERLGIKREGLRTIREYIFHRVQVNLGFGFLLGGFGLQLYGHAYPPPVDAEPHFPIVWIGVVVVLAVVLLSVSWWWSLFAFRRYMRDHFRTHPVDFEANLPLAREVGSGWPRSRTTRSRPISCACAARSAAPRRPRAPRRPNRRTRTTSKRAWRSGNVPSRARSFTGTTTRGAAPRAAPRVMVPVRKRARLGTFPLLAANPAPSSRSLLAWTLALPTRRPSPP